MHGCVGDNMYMYMSALDVHIYLQTEVKLIVYLFSAVDVVGCSRFTLLLQISLNGLDARIGKIYLARCKLSESLYVLLYLLAVGTLVSAPVFTCCDLYAQRIYSNLRLFVMLSLRSFTYKFEEWRKYLDNNVEHNYEG